MSVIYSAQELKRSFTNSTQTQYITFGTRYGSTWIFLFCDKIPITDNVGWRWVLKFNNSTVIICQHKSVQRFFTCASSFFSFLMNKIFAYTHVKARWRTRPINFQSTFNCSSSSCSYLVLLIFHLPCAATREIHLLPWFITISRTSNLMTAVYFGMWQYSRTDCMASRLNIDSNLHSHCQ
jgi:hypothetical protein